MRAHWDVIVLGLGGFGSAALAHVAKRGVTVLGLEQYALGHTQGSSHGESRIIRKAYFEHPDYVPLLEKAYKNWAHLEQESQTSLFERVGLFLAGNADSQVVSGTAEAARLHGLPLEKMTAEEARSTYRDFAFRDSDTVLFEADAGFLRVEDCVQSHLAWAKRLGAIVRDNVRVLDWNVVGQRVEVKTADNTYTADRIIVTAGAWANQLLKELEIPLVVKRKVAFWFDSLPDHYALASRRPTFFFDRPTGEFYGFPSLDGKTVKLAEHTGGLEVLDPALVNRDELPEDLERVAPFVKESLPYLGDRRRHSVCLYTCTPDGHFIIDRHPEWSQVTIGAGFSGHGFKFTAGLGEALSDLSVEGQTDQPVEFLRIAAGKQRWRQRTL